MAAGGLSSPPVDILEPDNIILTQITPRLDLDQLQGDGARIFQAVGDTDGDVGGLVLGEHEFLVTAGDFCGPLHHHPVLGAVVVHLQRQGGIGVHGDPLYLESVACVDGFVATPGAIDPAVVFVLGAFVALEAFHQFFHVLGVVLGGDHDGVGGFDDDHVVQAGGCQESVFGDDQAVSGLVSVDVAFDDITVLVVVAYGPEAGPGAYVGPLGV